MPLAAGLALLGFAAREVSAEAAAETAVLAVAAVVALLPAAFLARRAGEVALGAALVVGAGWVLQPGPTREAVVLTALAGLGFLVGARRLAASLPELPLAVALPLALAAQALLRTEALLPPAPAELGWRLPVILVALPAAGALATVALARRHGAARALLAAGTALLLGPGWNVATTLALVALAAGGVAADRTLSRRWRLVALLVLVAPLAWDPRAGALAAGAGLALAAGRGAPLVGALVALPLATVFALRAPTEAVAMLAWLPLLLPAVLLPAADCRRPAFAAVFLMLGAAAGGPSAAALAAPLALAALSLRRRGAPLAAQAAWTASLLAGASLLAAPPWLRQAPLAAAFGLLGAPVVAPMALAALLVAGFWLALGPALGAALRGRLAAGWTSGRVAAAAATATVLATLLVQRPATVAAPLPRDVTLAAESPSWEAALPPGTAPVRTVVLDSALAHSASLPAGRAVATVRLLDAAGREHAWTLRVGRDTGEWAAARPDVAARLRAGAPEPWLSWIVGDFPARRYRARWRLGDSATTRAVRIERAADLPPEVLVSLHYLELRR